MYPNHPTINEVSDYVLYKGEPHSAMMCEDNDGGLHLFIMADEDGDVMAKPVIGFCYEPGRETEAAQDWIALLVQRDVDAGDWDGDWAVRGDALEKDYEMCVGGGIADTGDITEMNPFGLTFCGGHGARDFLMTVADGVPEYEEEAASSCG